MLQYQVFKDISVEEFNPNIATIEEWEKQFSFMKKRHKEVSPDDPILPDELYKKKMQLQYNDPDMQSNFYIIRDIELKIIIGNAYIKKFTPNHTAYEENKFLGLFSIQLLAEYQRRGIGKKFLKIVYDFALKHNLKMLLAGTSEDAGKQFLNHIGANLGIASTVNRVKLSEINWTMLKHWVNTGQNNSPNTKVVFFESIPEDILENFANTYTELLNQIPLGELDLKMKKYTSEKLREEEKERNELGTKSFFFFTLEANNEISGLCILFYNPNESGYAVQGLTAVKRKYQNHGLGKWLKATMFLYIKDNYPDFLYILTGIANSNTSMLEINKKIGFKVQKEFVDAQVSIDNLYVYLNKL